MLSQFTGAAAELPTRCMVNPYDVDEQAEAMRDRGRDAARRSGGRACADAPAVREHNVYRWAGLLLSELERIPEGSANHASGSAS